jgi:hypothetical protein
VVGCCEYSDEPSGSGVAQLVRYCIVCTCCTFGWYTSNANFRCYEIFNIVEPAVFIPV